MTKVGLRELKNSLAAVIRRVRAGETVLITDRGEVVAELTPPREPENAVLAEMVRKGEIRLGKPILDKEALYRIPRVRFDINSQELLDAEREDR